MNKFLYRRIFFITCLLLLTAGQRSGRSSGCGATSCNVDTAPRTIAFQPGDANDYTFHFLVGTSTAVTGQGAVPSLLWANAKGYTAKTLLDSNSEGYIFDAASMLQFGGFRAVTIFDPPHTAPPHWAHLPYTYGDNGPAQTVPLQLGWALPIRTIRVVDHGLCYASAGVGDLATGLLNSLISSLSSCSTSLGRVGVQTTGIFRSAPADVSRPLTAIAVQDQLQWDIQIDGVIYTGLGSDCSIRTTASVDTRLVHDFKLVAGPTTGSRIQITNFQLLTGNSIGAAARAPGSVEATINDRIRGDFPNKFAASIHSNLIIPTPTGSALVTWKAGGVVSDYNNLNACKADSDCPDRHGPEDGCFKPSSNGEVLSPALVAYGVNGQLTKDGVGACVWRLEPKRINIAPSGIEIVLIENENDVQNTTVQLLAALNPGGALKCSVASPAPIDPLGPDAGGELQAGRALKSFP